MGQKAHPYGLRLGYIYDWKAKWFSRKDYSRLLHEDLKIRKFLKNTLKLAGVADIVIERSAGKVRIWIYTARPGIIIGRGGQEINRIRDEVSKLTDCEVFLDIKEVETPQTDAQLVAENVALQLEKRVMFRKAMKKAMASALAKGAGGIKIQCKGRLGGAEIARAEGYMEGKVPLSTFRANVKYGFAEAFTTYGTIGVKVWIYKGEILVKKEESERLKQLERQRSYRAGKREAALGRAAAVQAKEAAVPSVETAAPVHASEKKPAETGEAGPEALGI